MKFFKKTLRPDASIEDSKSSSKEFSRELSDKELDLVVGGMGKERFNIYITNLINSSRITD